MDIQWQGIAKGGIGGFLGGCALTALTQATGLVAIAPGIPVVAFVPLFTFLGAIYEGFLNGKK